MDFLGQLLAAEDLLARVDDLEIVRYAERRHRRTDVDDGDGLADAVVGQLVRQQRERRLHREGLDVDDLRAEAAELERGDPDIDVFTTRGSQQHIDHALLLFRRPEHLEIEVDLLHRIGDVLVGLELELISQSSSSVSVSGIEMILVITAEPATATAAFLVRVPALPTARLIAAPTASTSAMLFSSTVFCGKGTTA
jgi:hypothetical protein